MESNSLPANTHTSSNEQKIAPLNEDLPLVDRVKLAESYQFSELISPGSFIDAKDTVDNWCVATVTKVQNGEVTVNYDGWSHKYDFVPSFILIKHRLLEQSQ